MPRTADYIFLPTSREQVKRIVSDTLSRCMDEMGLVTGDAEIDMLATQVINNLERGTPWAKLESKEKVNG